MPAILEAIAAECLQTEVRRDGVRYTHYMTANTPRPGRNEPCHCGSGRKYKQCHLDKDEKAASAARAKAAAAAEAPAEPATEAETAAAKPKRAPKPESNQPWRATTNRGYIPRARTPRKVGGS
jgi:septal ring-binding cell division protein DamX